MTIGGRVRRAKKYRDIINPANCKDIVGRAAIGTEEDLEDAVTAAAQSFERWSKLPDKERSAACSAISEIIEKNANDLASLVTLEQGKPLKGLGSEFEIGGCAAWADATAKMSLKSKVLQKDSAADIELMHVPLGVVGSITPWNWPALIAVWHILPAIRTGNTVVIKPSPFTPLSTLRLIELINEVLPPGVVNCVNGDNEIGKALASHKRVSKVVFTGSIQTGAHIIKSSATNFKRLTLELGGNDAGIVLDDADPSKIAEELFWGAFINSGQTCAALKRLYVPESLYDSICGNLIDLAAHTPMGDGLEEGSLLGPLQNKVQFDKICSIVASARSDGAVIACGGEPLREGFFYPVTIATEAKDGMRIVDEEQFGPVLPIVRYHSIDDAIQSANRLDYGLCASVWSSDILRAKEVARRLDAGTVYLNKHAEVLPHVPFGGVKHSGIGVEFGENGLKAYTNIKVINAAV